MTTQMTPIEIAIAAAAAAAANQQAAQTAAVNSSSNTIDNAVALASASQGAVSHVTNSAPAAKLTMDDVTGSTMAVDLWLKPKEQGLLVGDVPDLFQDLPVVIDMKAFIVKYGIKNGNPAQYAYTTDQATCVTGGSWDSACLRIRALEPAKATAPYRCVDIPMLVPLDFAIDTIVDKAVVPKVLVKAGAMLGYTTSTTNWPAWEKFYKAVCDAGWKEDQVLVHVGSEPRINKNGNKWGTMTFKLIGLAANELATGE